MVRSYTCEYCNAKSKDQEWVDIDKNTSINICPKCADRITARKNEEYVFPRVNMEFILVKVVPRDRGASVGRKVIDVTLLKGSTVSEVLTAAMSGAFEAADLRINGRPADPNDKVNNGDIITLNPSPVWVGEATRSEVEKTEPPKVEIPVKPVITAKSEKRSRFEGIIE
jgi:hypothetical protein